VNALFLPHSLSLFPHLTPVNPTPPRRQGPLGKHLHILVEVVAQGGTGVFLHLLGDGWFPSYKTRIFPIGNTNKLVYHINNYFYVNACDKINGI